MQYLRPKTIYTFHAQPNHNSSHSSSSCYVLFHAFIKVRYCQILQIKWEYNLMNDLSRLGRVHRFKFISFCLSGFQHHDLRQHNSRSGYLEVRGHLPILLRAHYGADENRGSLWVSRFIHRLLIRRHDMDVVSVNCQCTLMTTKYRLLSPYNIFLN